VDWKRLVQFALLGSCDLEQYAILLVRVSLGLFFAISGANKLFVAGSTQTIYAYMYREARDSSERFAQEEGCTVEWSPLWRIEPVAFHPRLIELCEAAVKEVAGTPHRLPSGPLHDAAEVARAGIPSAMMFVQSLGGISHNKVEDTKEEHLELAVQAFARLAEKTAEWIRK
jgi:beta-ureidopropionase / N-carbamoyl-L-amino-acid hydrolase